MDNEKFPICPCCGAETDTYYRDRRTGDVVGCVWCIVSEDAWAAQPVDKI